MFNTTLNICSTTLEVKYVFLIQVESIETKFQAETKANIVCN